MSFAWVNDWMPELLVAALGTLRMTALAFLLAAFLGLLLALARLSRRASLSRLAFGYIEIVRGMPAVMLLFLIYFALTSWGITLGAFAAAVVGLGLNGAAYLAEIYRAGIGAIHPGQREAAQMLGMRHFQVMRYVIFPQALRVVLPPMANYLIALLKDTSIASLISAPELMLRARDLSSEYFMPMQLYLLVGAMYLAMAYPLSRGVRYMELRLLK
ncbi:MAG: amino acid ABC transporter permease [Acidisphaera sp.]|nr:amino acid ABC transporter permease [Acidisphaera sp.]